MRPDQDERRQPDEHARLDEPFAAGQADGQPLHELLPRAGQESQETEQREDHRAGRAEELGQPTGPFDHDRPACRTP